MSKENLPCGEKEKELNRKMLRGRGSEDCGLDEKI